MDNINFNQKDFPQYKTLVDEYWSSDVAWDRSTYVSYNINGRVWWKHGQRPSVTYFAKIYKVHIYDRFDTTRQYVMQIGMARQSTKELQVSKQKGIEIAAEHAVTHPIAVMYFEQKPMRKDFLKIVNVFRGLSNDHRLVMTREELETEKSMNDAYNDFLNDFEDEKKNRDCCNERKCENYIKNPLTEDEQKKESNVTLTKYKPMDFMECWRKDCRSNAKASDAKSSEAKLKKDETITDGGCDNRTEKKKVKVTTSKIDDELAADIADVLNTFSSILGLDIPPHTKEDVEDVELTPEDMKNIEILKKLNLKKLFHM